MAVTKLRACLLFFDSQGGCTRMYIYISYVFRIFRDRLRDRDRPATCIKDDNCADLLFDFTVRKQNHSPHA